MSDSAFGLRGRISHLKGLGVLNSAISVHHKKQNYTKRYAPKDGVLKLNFGLDDIPVFIDRLRDVERGEHRREEHPHRRVDEVLAGTYSTCPPIPINTPAHVVVK